MRVRKPEGGERWGYEGARGVERWGYDEARGRGGER